jgi:hypothetical protein
MDIITKVKKENSIISEKKVNEFFSKKDIADMSNESVDGIFDSVYKYIMKDAVYPHLVGISVN